MFAFLRFFRRRSRKSRQRGFSVTEVLAVATMLGTVPYSAYTNAKNRGAQTECMNNLQQIGQALVMYHLENGHYPKAAFYPKDPKKGNDSIRVHLDAIPGKMWVCPSLPEKLQEKGLGFVFNDNIAGVRNVANPDKKWVLIEINCVSKTAPAPHPKGYNILFADGHVITSKRLPKKITAIQQAKLERIHRLYHEQSGDQGNLLAHSHTH